MRESQADRPAPVGNRTDVLSGTVPLTATGAATLEVIASDAQHMTATDLFGVTFVP